MIKKILLSIVLVAVMVGLVWGGRAWNTLRVSAKTAKFNDDVDNIFMALQKYKERVGSYPMGGNAEVARSLQGANPKNVIVIIGRKLPVNDKGEFIDPWGTPLRIYFSDTGVLVRSAGQNRRFDDSTVMDADDYYRSN